jgi:pilin isopeptide linkage protein
MRTVRVKKLMKALSLGMAFLLTVGTIHVRTFAAEASTATAMIQVEAKVTGDQADDAEFTFKLTAADETTPMPDSDTVTIKGEGQAEFGPITYTDVGTYNYTVSQQDNQLPYYTYDLSVYHVTVTVIYTEDGALSAGFTAKKNSERTKSGDITFINEHHEPTPTPTEPTPTPTEPTPTPTEPTPTPTEPTPTPAELTPTPTTELTPTPASTGGTPQNPSGGTPSGSGTTSVKTGDETPIGLYVFMLVVFAGVILLVITARRRHR